jgi:molecular chaperone DnaK
MELLNPEDGEREIKLLTTQGNSRLGGKDWDDILVKYVASVFSDKFGEDPLDDLQAYQEIYNKCVAAKESLSRMPKTTVIVNYNGNFCKVEITRGQFETMTTHLVDECRDLAKRAMNDKGLDWDGIDQILLVGGSTYMPMVRNMLTELSDGTPLNDEVNPSLAVSLGAAIATTTVQTEDGKPAVEGALPPVKVDYIISHSVGIVYVDTSDGEEDKVKVMLHKDAKIPARFDHTFGTLHDKTTAVNLRIMQGEDEMPDLCEEIGTGKLTGIPPRPAGEPIEVTFELDENQILLVTAKHVDSGREVTVKVERPGLTDEAKKAAKERVGELTIFTS